MVHIMALCCQNQEYRSTDQSRLHSSASISDHSSSIMVLHVGLQKMMAMKKELVQNGVCSFQVNYLKRSNGS